MIVLLEFCVFERAVERFKKEFKSGTDEPRVASRIGESERGSKNYREWDPLE